MGMGWVSGGVFSFGYNFFLAFYLVKLSRNLGARVVWFFPLDFGFTVMGGWGYESWNMLGLFAYWELLSPQIYPMAIANIHFTVTVLR